MSSPLLPPDPAAAPSPKPPPPLAESLTDLPDVQVVVPPAAARVPPAAPSSAPRPGGAASRGANMGGRPAVTPAVEMALRQAQLLRTRGDLPGAVAAARAIIAQEPDSPPAHELLGDLQMQAGSPAEALASYRRAESHAYSAALEGKIARATLHQQSSGASRFDADAAALHRGNAPLLWIAGLLVPGLGLALAGQYRAAVISFAGVIGTGALLLVLPPTHALLDTYGRGLSAVTAAPPPTGALLLTLVLGLANLAFYVYSLVETARVAKPAGKV